MTSCWFWTGRYNGFGYGLVGSHATQKVAHRMVYEFLVGPVPEGLTLDHLCRNRPCVNPAHLEPVAFRENVLRGVGPTAENARKTHCRHGHELAGENLLMVGPEHTRRECRACDLARARQRRRERAAAEGRTLRRYTPPKHARRPSLAALEGEL
jgi:hypothetical protein